MNCIFYDRKNNLEVNSKDLKNTKLVEMRLVVDSDEYTTGLWLGPTKHPAYLQEHIISNLCYKTKDCPKYCNWDKDTSVEHLVFLRFE
jgi:hypothetical protein